MDRQPDRRLARMSPFDTMARVRRDVQIVTGLELACLGLAVEAQAGAAGQQHNPFGFILVVPEAGRTRLSGRDDPFDAHVRRCKQRGDVLAGSGVWEPRKQSFRSAGSRSLKEAAGLDRLRDRGPRQLYFFMCFFRKSSARGQATFAAASV